MTVKQPCDSESNADDDIHRPRNVALTQRFKCYPKLRCEDIRLLPGGKVPTFLQSVVVQEIRESLYDPTLRSLIELIRKRTDCNRDFNSLGAKNANLFSQYRRAEDT